MNLAYELAYLPDAKIQALASRYIQTQLYSMPHASFITTQSNFINFYLKRQLDALAAIILSLTGYTHTKTYIYIWIDNVH